MRWVLTKSSPLLLQPLAAFIAWLETELSAGTTACFVTLTPVMVSVYGIPLLPMRFAAAASTSRSKSASCSSLAIRACSSATATRVTSSRSRSSRRDRSSRPLTASPASQNPTPAVSSASQAGIAGGVPAARDADRREDGGQRHRGGYGSGGASAPGPAGG